ncbi:MAG: FHA domain-containing protein [Myxococcaceae bacterium]|nr:FHA domain-containing protein [Myxococcaceae bacterium]
MPISGVPLSMLARQALVLGSGLAARYPTPFLVWEPGSRVEAAPTPVPVTTVVPLEAARPKSPLEGDPLCFALKLEGAATRLSVGRSLDNDLVLDDLTISRVHFFLSTRGEGQWVLWVAPDAHASTLVRRMSVQPGDEVQLVDRCTISAGGIHLTFYAPGRLIPRILEKAEHLKG